LALFICNGEINITYINDNNTITLNSCDHKSSTLPFFIQSSIQKPKSTNVEIRTNKAEVKKIKIQIIDEGQNALTLVISIFFFFLLTIAPIMLNEIIKKANNAIQLEDKSIKLYMFPKCLLYWSPYSLR
jgi:hypothetical protein